MERLKPVDVRNAAFGKPPPGRRGYDESEVDAFLDRVEKTLSQLYHELALLRGEPTTPGGVGGRQLALPSGLNGVKNANGHSANGHSANGHSANGHGAIPDGPGPGEEAILAELDQIKLRLARIETAVTTNGRPAYNNGFGGY